jgi:acetolactate synthase-1/2/3 large subunit
LRRAAGPSGHAGRSRWRRRRLTQGIIKANLGRMRLGNKLRLVGRAAWRRVVTPA